MADYSNAVIYIITTGDGLYVGSTRDFEGRKRKHKSVIYNEHCPQYNFKLYQNIRANDNDWNMELYKPFPCENEDELRQEEERVRIELNANLNGQRAYTSKEKRKEERKEYCKEYYEKNKDELKAKQKLYNENNRDEISVKTKAYREKNRGEISARMKLYREKNRAVINARNCKIITCECGSDITRNNIAIHRKTKKHLNSMKSLEKLI